ncbi:MAG: glycosyltransferase family 2 protein [Chloroflexi bacterium]|nr:glycosyltransferase family 2 protein [Chloroflexota bacterium]
MPDLAVVIVTWNVRDLVLAALRSLFADLAASDLTADVYVVDSASSDGTADAVAAAFPQVKLTACSENRGFAAGNNLALRQMGFGEPPAGDPADLPRAVYLLNPDTITQPGATRALFATLFADQSARDRRVGMVGARLSFGDGSFQHSAFGFPGLRQLWAELFPTPGRLIEQGFNGRYPRDLYAGDQPFPVDFVLGATMMLRREVICEVGLLDAGFFMYCEEIDWALRIHRAGWGVRCVPAAHVIHLGGQSAGQVRPQTVIRLWTSRLRLYRKHYPAWKVFLAERLIAAGMRRKARQAIDEPAAIREAYETIERLALKR